MKLAALAAALISSGCAKSALDLSPFPCALDRTCPTGFSCNAATQCVVSPTCPSPTVDCAAVCTDRATDAANCGACGNACGAGGHCCGGACVSFTDGANCGGCGVQCPGRCTAGACHCLAGETLCADGCYSLSSEPTHCGSCTNKCATGAPCVSSQCGPCPGGQTVCSGACTDTSSDSSHCGNCATSCGAGKSCVSGICCAAGQIACSGACVASDVNNCNACNNKCAAGATCTASGCQCPAGQSICSAACVDLQSSAANCGACGVACNGTCTQGRCLQLLATSKAGGYGLAMDSNFVYWTDGDSILRKVPKSGGSPIQLAPAVPGQSVGFGLAVDSSNAYWVGGGQVFRTPIDGGSATPITPSGTPGDLTLDSQYVYYVESGAISKVPLDGGAATPIVTGINQPRRLTSDSLNLYWTNYCYAQVLKMAKAGGAVTPIADHLGACTSGIAVDPSYAYFTAAGVAEKVAIDGGTPLGLGGGASQWGLAIDGVHVYLSNDNAGTVARLPIDGGTMETLASGQSFPISIAVDGTSLYWLNNMDGTLMKLTPK